jgi:hypothetical protein
MKDSLMDFVEPKKLIWIKIMSRIKINKPQVFPHNLDLNPIADNP